MSGMNILVLDDEKRIRDELAEFLSDNGHSVFQAGKPSEIYPLMNRYQIDLAIVDINLPEKDGLTVLREIKHIDNDVEVLIITGQGDMDKAIEAMRAGAADFFTKPVRLGEVVTAIERTKRYMNLSRQYSQIRNNYNHLLQELQDGMGLQMIGKSKAQKKIDEDIKIVASNPNVSVMICGESGTGKELVARCIHYLSSRKKNYFYPVNCAAIPETLFESEFFGYVKGAFTNAATNKAGWFEIANKGTLFLDEIGDMQPMMQAKLLRIVEDGKVRRLGSNNELSVDVRIITATNRNIEQLVSAGAFRQDLFHRINTFQITIPPLRERKDDIPLMIEHFLQHFAHKSGKEISSIENSLLDNLVEYHFPGNVRELKNMIERAVLLCNGSKLTVKHFCLNSISTNKDRIHHTDDTPVYDLALVEKETIQRALKQTNNNKLQAAKLLNISWQALARKLKKIEE
jgi:DNA-binding NtrC family response regulator